MDESKDILVDSVNLEIRKQESFMAMSMAGGEITNKEGKKAEYSMEIAGRMLLLHSGNKRFFIDLIPAIEKMATLAFKEEG